MSYIYRHRRMAALGAHPMIKRTGAKPPVAPAKFSPSRSIVALPKTPPKLNPGQFQTIPPPPNSVNLPGQPSQLNPVPPVHTDDVGVALPMSPNTAVLPTGPAGPIGPIWSGPYPTVNTAVVAAAPVLTPPPPLPASYGYGTTPGPYTYGGGAGGGGGIIPHDDLELPLNLLRTAPAPKKDNTLLVALLVAGGLGALHLLTRKR